MSTLGEGLPIRQKLPTTLSRNHFIVGIKMVEEDEGLNENAEGLVEQEVSDDIPLKVVMLAEACAMVTEGCEVLMSPDHFLRPRTAFRIDDMAYYVYSEQDVLGIW